MPERVCVNPFCKREHTNDRDAGRCRPCAIYRRRNGTERPRALVDLFAAGARGRMGQRRSSGSGGQR